MSKLEIISWNIQAGRGTDGRTDLDRIARTVRDFGDADVICFQEVARHMPGITSGMDLDEPDELARRFSEYEPVFRPSVDFGNRQFGCMVFSRHPVLGVRNHLLPRPFFGEYRSMQRQALEVTLDTPGQPLRVTTTHLEYHSNHHQRVQVNRLREIHRDTSQRAHQRDEELAAGDSPYYEPPFAEDGIECGDFNFLPNSATHEQITAVFGDKTPQLLDAWMARYGDTPHPDTCGISDHDQWPQGPHCRDFFFVTKALGERISELDVDQRTRASDHQPILIRFDR